MNTAAGIRSEAEVVEQTEQDRTGEGSLPGITDAASVAPRDARELSRQFFRRLAELEEGTHEYQYARNTLIEMNMSLVRFDNGDRGRQALADVKAYLDGINAYIDASDSGRY
ncbi:RNA polymerase sigma factor SigF, partial [Streptomyces eurythermus]